MKTDLPRIPPHPIIVETINRLREIIAKLPPQAINPQLSGRLGKIIEERIADVPLEQRPCATRVIMLEILLTTPFADVAGGGVNARDDVPLEGLLRRYAALELARLWLSEMDEEGFFPKADLKAIFRQREVKHIEDSLFLAKESRKRWNWLIKVKERVGRRAKAERKLGAREAVVHLFNTLRKHGWWTGHGYHSVGALKNYFQTWRNPRS
jgi:hypothetical protein